MQGSDALPAQRASSAKGFWMSPTTGHSTKLERMTRRIGRIGGREELLSSAQFMIKPLSNKDNAIITTTDLNLVLILMSIGKGWVSCIRRMLHQPTSKTIPGRNKIPRSYKMPSDSNPCSSMGGSMGICDLD